MTEINGGKFNLENEKAFSQAIARKFGLTNEQVNNIDWNPIFEILKNGNIKFGEKVNNIFNFDNIIHNGDTFEFSSDKWQDIAGMVEKLLAAKNISSGDLNEIKTNTPNETEEQPEEPKAEDTPIDYFDSARFKPKKIDKSKTEIKSVNNNSLVKFYDTDKTFVKEVMVFDTNQTKETYFNNGIATHSILRGNQGSILYINVFDKDGNVIMWQDENGEIHHNSDNNKELHFDREKGYLSALIEYDEYKNKIAETKYDQNGRIKEHVIYDTKGHKIKEVYDTNYSVFEYDENGNNIKETIHKLNGEIANFRLKEYDTSGNVINVADFDSTGKVVQHSTFEYDETGNNVKFTEYDEENNVSTYTLSEYDKNGNRIKSTNYTKNNMVRSILGFEYDKNGNVTKETGYNPDGSLKWSRAYEYNEAGKNTKESELDSEGRPEWSTTYEYDGFGNKVKETDFNSNNEITSYSVWEHDSEGNWKWVKHQTD